MVPQMKAIGDAILAAVKPLQMRVKALEERPTMAKLTETIDSLERRASRHATHLAALEDRLKILEHK